MDRTILTLEARGNIMFEVLQEYFGLSSLQMHTEINTHFDGLLSILKSKKIDYSSLKGALVPDPDRKEAAFVFDTQQIESSWYGLEVFEKYFPLLPKKTTQSVLCGDMIGTPNNQDFICEIFEENVELVRSVEWLQSNQFYVVYVNNLTDQMLGDIRSGLEKYGPYVGIIDCTFPSKMKTYLSTCLVNAYVKTNGIIIQGHEDDRDNSEDINMIGYPFEEYGFKCKSLQSMYEGAFLSYKIEREVFEGFESDEMFSLNALTGAIVPLAECAIEIEDNKLQYLVTAKQGSMKKAGLLRLSKDAVEQRIRDRLSQNYIFNLTFKPEHNVLKFNTILNITPEDTFDPVRLMLSLEYKPEAKSLRLITMF